MASRVWVVRAKGAGEGGGLLARLGGRQKGLRGGGGGGRNWREEQTGRVGRAVENLPTAATAMPPNRVRAILINRRCRGRRLVRVPARRFLARE
ncbi:hypothetical protein KM043_007034 [Ampulex compressa]|nr:hypothetical protein KM043_007034 [Ampulex compressa]